MGQITKDPFFHLKLPYQEGSPSFKITSTQRFWELVQSNIVIENFLYSPKVLTFIKKPVYEYKIKKINFSNVGFSRTEIRNIEFRNCTFVDCLFVGTTFKNVEFHDCKFTNCNMLGCKFDNVYIDPKIFKKCLDPKRHSNIGASLYKKLATNLKEMDQPLFCDNANFQFSKWKRYSDEYKARQEWRSVRNEWKKSSFRKKLTLIVDKDFLSEILSNCWVNIKLFFNLIVLQEMFGYWVSISKMMRSSLIILFIFVIINYRNWLDFGISTDGKLVASSYTDSFYYTLITITSLGYGDLVPLTDSGRVWASIQSIIGVFWLGIVIALFVGKVERFKK